MKGNFENFRFNKDGNHEFSFNIDMETYERFIEFRDKYKIIYVKDALNKLLDIYEEEKNN